MMSIKERNERTATEKAIQKEIRACYVLQKARMKSKLTKEGILTAQYEIEMLGKNPQLKPSNGLSLSETIEAMQEAVDNYLNNLKT